MRKKPVLLLLALLLRPVPARTEDLDALLLRLGELARTHKTYPSPNHAPADLLLESVRNGQGAAEILLQLETRFRLTSEAARFLARAVAVDQIVRWKRQERPPELPSAEALAAIESDYITAARAAPDSAEILGSLADFYANLQYASRALQARYPDNLLSLVREATDPGRQALLLMTARLDHGITCRLTPLALDRYPENPALLHLLAERIWFPAVRAPLAGRAGKALARFPTKDSRIALDLAEMQVSALLESGLSRRAIQVYEALPAELKKRIGEGATGVFKTEIGGVPYNGMLRDLRLDLSAAYFLEGRSETAAKVLRGFEPAARSPVQGAPMKFAVIRSLLGLPSSSDPFDLLAEAFGKGALYPAPWARVLARFCERAGYGQARAQALRKAAEQVREIAGMKGGDLACIAKLTERETAELARELQTLAEMLENNEASRSQAEAAAVDSMAPTMARLLAAPSLARFQESPLPSGISPIELSGDETSRRLRALEKEIRLPPGFRLARAERRGGEILAIATRDEGLYATFCWFLRSVDGGASWSKPLYTGLRASDPYSVRAFSDLPLVNGDRLQIEVDAWEEDPEGAPTIMGGHVKKKRSGITVEIPLDLLSRDSDGDGLTDLLEEALFTDPNNSDTDGDGFGDAEDSAPQVAFDPRESDESRALDAVVEKLAGWSTRRAARVRRPGSRIEETPPDPEVAFRRVFVLVGERSLFASLRPSARILVLTPKEAKLTRENLGRLSHAYWIATFLLSRDRTRAFVSWFGNNESGSFRVVNRDGIWYAEELSHVVS